MLGCKLLPEPCQVGAQVLDARDIRARVCVRACLEGVARAGRGRVDERARMFLDSAESSALLRARGPRVRAARGENSLSQSFRSESVIGRDIIDR